MATAAPSPIQPRRIIAATLVVAAVLAGFGLAYLLSGVLFLLFVGIVLATAIEPMVAALQRYRAGRSLAVTVVYVCLMLALVAAIVLIAPYLADQARELMSDIPRANQQVRQWLENAGNILWARIARRLVAEFSSTSAVDGVEHAVAAVSQTASYLAIIASGILSVGVVVLLAFYWSLQGDRTIRWLLLLLPDAKRDDARDTIAQMEGKVGAYLRGQAIVCLAMAAMATAVYGLLGLRYAIVLGMIAGLMEVLPVLGPVLAAIPPLGVAVFTDRGKTLWVLLAAVVMQQAEGYLLVPRVMDKSVGVHPMVTLLALATFGAVLGIPGAILAIPLAAIIQVLLNRYVLGPEASEPQQPSGRGSLGVLQYEAQELLHDIRLHDRAAVSGENLGHLSEAIEAVARDLEEQLHQGDGQTETEGLS